MRSEVELGGEEARRVLEVEEGEIFLLTLHLVLNAHAVVVVLL